MVPSSDGATALLESPMDESKTRGQPSSLGMDLLWATRQKE